MHDNEFIALGLFLAWHVMGECFAMRFKDAVQQPCSSVLADLLQAEVSTLHLMCH